MLSPDVIERLRGHLYTARRRLDTARSHTGRLATAAGTAAAGAGLFTTALTTESLLATAAATGAGLLVLPTGKAAKFREVQVRTEHTDALGASRSPPARCPRTRSRRRGRCTRRRASACSSSWRPS
ncbi:hypothetical protein ACODT4_41320 [Streptomyces sp. 2.9]|uniref:hypothetical protein n=1 Tax=Streptomyces tritrimontium TaxID=3406573 RepID=UPI003BB6B69B